MENARSTIYGFISSNKNIQICKKAYRKKAPYSNLDEGEKNTI